MSAKKGLFLGMLAAVLLVVSGCGTQGSGKATLQGKLVNLCGSPIAYKTVYVPGHDPVLSDADGSFTVEDVAAPYDLVIANAYFLEDETGETPILVYQGLTEMEPTVAVRTFGDADKDGCNYVTVGGSLSSEDAGTNYAVVTSTDYSVSKITASWQEENTYSLNQYVAPGDRVYLQSLFWNEGDDGQIATFVGEAHDSFVSNGEDATKNLQFAPITTGSASVSVTAPVGVIFSSVRHYAYVEGYPAAVQLETKKDSDAVDGKIAFATPNAEGWGSLFFATGKIGLETESVTGSGIATTRGDVGVWRRVPDNGSAEVDMQLPDPLVPIVPLNGATIDSGSSFSWMGPEDAVYFASFNLRYDGGSASIQVITKNTSLTLPDLASLGLNMDGVGKGYWLVGYWKSNGLPDSVDEAATLESVRKLALLWNGAYPTDEGEIGFALGGFFLFAGESTNR